MFKLYFKALFLFLFLCPSLVVAKEKSLSGIKKSLSKRKRGFETYIANRDKQVRLSASALLKIKKSRRQRRLKRERARRKFRRTSEIFPIKAYRKYIRKRDQKVSLREKNQKAYRKYKKSIRNIEKLKPYRINKELGYRLE